MKLEELKACYTFYLIETEDRIKREKYSKGFAYRAGLQEDILEENKAVLRLIKEKEKRLS